MAKDKAEDAGPEMVSIVVTADHFYLPLDEQGNGRADWATTSDEQQKVEKRARLQVPKDLGQMLSDREQVELL